MTASGGRDALEEFFAELDALYQKAKTPSPTSIHNRTAQIDSRKGGTSKGVSPRTIAGWFKATGRGVPRSDHDFRLVVQILLEKSGETKNIDRQLLQWEQRRAAAWTLQQQRSKTETEVGESRSPWWHRRLLTGSAAVSTAVVVVLVSQLALCSKDEPRPNCSDIGVFLSGSDGWRYNRQVWVDAYNSAGGKAVLGCPVSKPEQGFVHPWDQGYSQDLVGGSGRQSRLMATVADRVIVMTGDYWHDYTYPHRQHAARIQGYPESDPITCGEARIVALEKGEQTPGAMITSPTNKFVWLPRPVWRKYQQMGGLPVFGRPLNPLNQAMTGVIEFEHGRIALSDGNVYPELDDPQRQAGPVTELCPN
ncbi:hypothetical protein IU449_27715 [Nocardia higoensis]|uniref:Uncharacterized protein n=1 Tax=Nocardia higoensis TaxID=228599 RepID=A0ABS0DIK8_9NOCA|nr:hypothetical protein [Nocardia higoensis]MBF6358290.1 hypothetical protein [Nocardia higoensis]